jgi:hypothetical protein
MPVPPVWARRLLVAPLVVVVEGLLLLVSPLLLVAAVVLSPLFGGWRPVRLLLIGLALVRRHLTALLECLRLWARGRARDDAAHYAILAAFVSGAYRVIVRLARVEVLTDAESGDAEAALSDRSRPVVVLYRHAGEGDSLLAVHQLLCGHGRRPRLVMHEVLRLDPVIDVLGTRLPNRFLDPRGGDTEREIAAMAADLGPADALLIFPEGGNVSPERRRKGIERLERAGHAEQAAQARAMAHVVAPRPGGALAALEAAPEADVVIVGHVGFPTGFGELWRLLSHRLPVQVRLWHVPAADVPTERDAQIEWLFGWWGTLDRWVGEHMSARP